MAFIHYVLAGMGAATPGHEHALRRLRERLACTARPSWPWPCTRWMPPTRVQTLMDDLAGGEPDRSGCVVERRRRWTTLLGSDRSTAIVLGAVHADPARQAILLTSCAGS